MEINKQLFEDVLSGKLKGTFVLRNGEKLNSSLLLCSGNIDNRVYAIGTDKYYIYYDDGAVRTYPYKPSLYIIDFIPETNMKENELTIEIPDGKIVDWEESKKQNKIVLKDKQLTYKGICEKLFKYKEFFFTNSTGVIESSSPTHNEYLANAINSSTFYHQLECILAKNMLANVAKYMNNGWNPTVGDTAWYIISYGHNNIDIAGAYFQHSYCSSRIIFKSKELAQQAIEILGEETVKLALEPLGI